MNITYELICEKMGCTIPELRELYKTEARYEDDGVIDPADDPIRHLTVDEKIWILENSHLYR